jgi:glucan phosphoethanolaminetransferase (alkaline phosphatase superfamily)
MMTDMNDDTKVNERRMRLLAVLMCLEKLTVFIAIALLMIMPLFITVIRLSFSMMVIQLISIIVIIMLALYVLAVFIHTRLMRNNTTVNDANTGNDDTYSEDNTDYSSIIVLLNSITSEM